MIRQLLLVFKERYGISRVCRVLNCSRTLLYYKRKKKNDEAIEQKLKEKADRHPREGFWKAYYRLRLDGYPWNHKRVHRVYVQLGLPMRRKAKKRLPARVKAPLVVPQELNHTWSVDFTEDRLENGRKFRSFNVIDDANREVLFVESDFSLPSNRILWVLNHLVKRRGKPEYIRMDNGPEFIAKLTADWSKARQISFRYIQPGKPTQNAYIERFNGTFRRGVLDAHIFKSIDQVRDVTEEWVHDYNNCRPHDSLGNLPPRVFADLYLRGGTPSQIKKSFLL